jgi:uncharacterized protein (DUF362 family)/Pyruvate/2-oxoacid:ferredoxin oxidoreductase delta subunit
LSILSEVALVRAETYQPEILSDKITEALNLLGGLNRFVKPGMKVLLKPNLLSAKGPDRAITTHPEFVAAVARMVRGLGAEVRVGDSPAGAKAGIQRVWDETGLSAVAARDGLELVSFERSGTTPVMHDTRVYHVARPVLEADLVINLPKLKTHVLTLMTGGVKNTFGVIPGFRKGLYHKEAPNPRHFSRILIDIFSIVQPELTIMDGITVMDGDGPASGRVRPGGRVLASADAVALDTVAAYLIGLPSEQVHTIRYAAEAGLGIGYLDGITLKGERLDAARIADFKLTSNRTMELLPKFLMDVVGPFIWLRPKVDRELCLACGECVSSCPVNALHQPDDATAPLLNDKKCINCWCCHEICPSKAVFIDKSWLARRFVR